MENILDKNLKTSVDIWILVYYMMSKEDAGLVSLVASVLAFCGTRAHGTRSRGRCRACFGTGFLWHAHTRHSFAWKKQDWFPWLLCTGFLWHARTRHSFAWKMQDWFPWLLCTGFLWHAHTRHSFAWKMQDWFPWLLCTGFLWHARTRHSFAWKMQDWFPWLLCTGFLWHARTRHSFAWKKQDWFPFLLSTGFLWHAHRTNLKHFRDGSILFKPYTVRNLPFSEEKKGNVLARNGRT